MKENSIYVFDNNVQKERFNHTLKQLRCLVCKNQSLHESSAAIAKQFKQQIYLMVKANYSEQQIINTLVADHGRELRYKPEYNLANSGLWTLSILIILWSLAKVATKVIKHG